MNLELRLWMEHHKMICPHCHAPFIAVYGDATVQYWHFDGYCKKKPEVPKQNVLV